MVNAGRLAGCDAQDFEIEWMSILQIGGIFFAAERDGNAFAEAGEFPFRRNPRIFRDVGEINFLHANKNIATIASRKYGTSTAAPAYSLAMRWPKNKHKIDNADMTAP
ncbi:MAG: hypothetical protein QOG48_975 [Verrucomicrobiota bacterium]